MRMVDIAVLKALVVIFSLVDALTIIDFSIVLSLVFQVAFRYDKICMISKSNIFPFGFLTQKEYNNNSACF